MRSLKLVGSSFSVRDSSPRLLQRRWRGGLVAHRKVWPSARTAPTLGGRAYSKQKRLIQVAASAPTRASSNQFSKASLVMMFSNFSSVISSKMDSKVICLNAPKSESGIRVRDAKLCRPAGAWNYFSGRFPTVETVGYFRPPLSAFIKLRRDRPRLLIRVNWCNSCPSPSCFPSWRLNNFCDFAPSW